MLVLVLVLCVGVGVNLVRFKPITRLVHARTRARVNRFQHRRGKRRAHETRPTEGATADAMREQLEGNAAAAEGTTAKFMAELERARTL